MRPRTYKAKDRLEWSCAQLPSLPWVVILAHVSGRSLVQPACVVAGRGGAADSSPGRSRPPSRRPNNPMGDLWKSPVSGIPKSYVCDSPLSWAMCPKSYVCDSPQLRARHPVLTKPWTWQARGAARGGAPRKDSRPRAHTDTVRHVEASPKVRTRARPAVTEPEGPDPSPPGLADPPHRAPARPPVSLLGTGPPPPNRSPARRRLLARPDPAPSLTARRPSARLLACNPPPNRLLARRPLA